MVASREAASPPPLLLNQSQQNEEMLELYKLDQKRKVSSLNFKIELIFASQSEGRGKMVRSVLRSSLDLEGTRKDFEL